MSKEEGLMKSEIISISLSKLLLDKIDSLQEQRNFSSRSEVIRHALQSYIVELERTTPDNSVGVYIASVSYYNLKTKPIDLQEIIKDFNNQIAMTSRINVSNTVTVVIYLLKTNINLARVFFEKLSMIRGLIDKKLFSIKTIV
ncbi:MAG: CopG family ribbon-helix-helix protein [Promethearchaeota archaeon]